MKFADWLRNADVDDEIELPLRSPRDGKIYVSKIRILKKKDTADEAR